MAEAHRNEGSIPLGIVVVGRGGTPCLRRCLSSIDFAGTAIVYVDRSANEASCEVARDKGAEVLRTDGPDAGTMASARNAGFRRLLEIAPSVELVQFVDGDCELSAGWLAKAVKILGKDKRLAAVCGLMRERNPQQSLYGRLRDLEHSPKIGEIAACSSAFLAKRSAFEDAGGFEAELTGGEEAELCSRLRVHGWRIRRVDTLMCLRDSGISTFSQWWQHEIERGHGALDLATRFGDRPDARYVATVRSARVWGIGVPAAIASASMVGASAGGPTLGLALAGTGLLALPAESVRIATRAGRQGQPLALALTYGGLSVLARFAHVVGQLQYLLARADARSAASQDQAASAPTLRAADDMDWRTDKRRYRSGAWLTERSIWALAAYRFGKRVEAGPECPTKTVLRGLYACCHWLADTVLKIDLPLSADIGPGLLLHRRGGIVVRPGAKIGANVMLAQGCMIGHGGAEPPVLEDDVEIGAHAQVVDGVRVGNGARVTAMSVVMSNVAARITVAGNPAKRVLKPGRGAATTKRSADRLRANAADRGAKVAVKPTQKAARNAKAKAVAKPTQKAARTAKAEPSAKPTQKAARTAKAEPSAKPTQKAARTAKAEPSAKPTQKAARTAKAETSAKPTQKAARATKVQPAKGAAKNKTTR